MSLANPGRILRALDRRYCAKLELELELELELVASLGFVSQQRDQDKKRSQKFPAASG
jgi:hypothetical protein